MKILALGALWVPYIRNNWFDAVRHVFGAHVLCVNVGPLLVKRKYSGSLEGYHCAYIYDLLRRGEFDYLFFYQDWISEDFPEAFFDKVRLAGVRTVAFYPDDEPEHWYARNLRYDHHFDLVASHSSRGTARRSQSGAGERAMYLPWGYNRRDFYPVPESNKCYDVVFIGKHKVNDARGKVHVEDGEQREQVLVALAEACATRGWTFRIFGFGWDQHPKLKQYYGGIPSQEEMLVIYHQTKVVFNPAWSSDGSPGGVQTKLRHFEVPGCGAFQITNENMELAELFIPDKEIVFYLTIDDLLEKIEKYVGDDDSREQIAEAGHARALREHTLDHRVRALFRHVQHLFPCPAYGFELPARVKSLKIKDLTALVELSEELDRDESRLGDAQWVHVIAGSFLNVTLDYAALEPFFLSAPNEILGIDTFINFAGLAANPLQPKLIENGSFLLSGEVSLLNFNFPLLEEQGGYFLGSHSGDIGWLLVNYLAPRNRLRELLKTFALGTPKDIQQLNPLHTGRVVTEILLQVPLGNPNGIGIRGEEYARRLSRLLPRFVVWGWRVVIFGISGMGQVTLELAENTPGLELQAIVDQSLKVVSFNGIPVVAAEHLADLRPDVIIITAGASGASIYSSIAHLEASTCILPLFDLDHPVWRVVCG